MLYLSSGIRSQTEAAAPPQKDNQKKNEPLSNVNEALKQASSIKVDQVMGEKMMANMSIVLNEMAANLRKMFAENKRLNNQVQEVLQRVQNVTGVNATSTIKNLQQQSTANMTYLNSLNLSTLMPRHDN